MQAYQREFIDFMVDCGVLTFGDFTTKSGRKTPYFLNSGRYATGGQLSKLASFYATAIESTLGDGFDVLFGPAYKGIPLCVATAMQLNERGHDVGFCFNRKETKDHGEGGLLVGAQLHEGARVLIIEDVTTAGTSIRESVPLLKQAAKVSLVGLVVSVDRQERGTGEHSALQEIRETYGMQTFAIVSIDQVLAHLRGQAALSEQHYQAALEYRQRYGAQS